MFKVGDLAVYPAQGVGVIEAIEAKDIGGEKLECYILRLVVGDMTIMVPVTNAEMVGLRSPIKKENLAVVYGILAEEMGNGKIASWSRRQREYTEKIRSGDLKAVAEVFRELCHLKVAKDLSYGEKKFLEQARKLLVTEIAMVEGAKEEKVEEQLEHIFH